MSGFSASRSECTSLSSRYLGRLAPSPTGDLHPGHAATFSIAEKRCRERNGNLILRVEDLDQARCKDHFTPAMIEDLQWVGITWDEGPGSTNNVHLEGRLYLQSERLKLYEEAWLKLYRKGCIYPCPLSRKDIMKVAAAPPEGEELVFPVSLRPSNVEINQSYTCPQDGPKGVNWRFRVPESRAVSFTDNCLGPQTFVAGQHFGDFVVFGKDNFAAYELAVVVDDAEMTVTEVVRGADLLLSTARQLLLYEQLEAAPPQFYHCPLVLDESGIRMAKRHGSTTIRALREAGWSRERIEKEMCASVASCLK